MAGREPSREHDYGDPAGSVHESRRWGLDFRDRGDHKRDLARVLAGNGRQSATMRRRDPVPFGDLSEPSRRVVRLYGG